MRKVELRTWVSVVKAARWGNPPAVKQMFGSADILRDGRVVFDIAGNKYRLVAWVNYEYAVVYVRFIATHHAYDKIDAQDCLIEETSMDVRPIRTEDDYQASLTEISSLMSAESGSPEGDRLDVLATLVEAYEAEKFPIKMPDPISAIEFMMAQKQLTRRDLEPAIGTRARVAEVLKRRRPLTLPMIRALSRLLDIPADVLIQPYDTVRISRETSPVCV